MISIIAAVGKNNELGKNNNLIWHFKEDMEYFKEKTNGKKIVMGYNTFLSLPKKLENREYIILSHRDINEKDITVFNDFDKLLNYVKNLDEEIMIIGGASIYNLFIPYADKIYLTEIDLSEDADVYFPIFDKKNFKKNVIKECIENDINFKFVLYERLK